MWPCTADMIVKDIRLQQLMNEKNVIHSPVSVEYNDDTLVYCAGTSLGTLSLWDVRSALCVTRWQHPRQAAVTALAATPAPPARLGLRRARAGAAPLLYVACGGDEVCLWDAQDCSIHQVHHLLGGRWSPAR